MGLQRRQPALPGLARLLADAAEQRRAALADAWGVPLEGGGLAARLYHRMTDPDGLRSVVAALDDDHRLVFRALAAATRPVTARALAQTLPFDDLALDAMLAQLAERGLVWWSAPTGRERDAAQPRWLVPRDLASAARPRRGPTPVAARPRSSKPDRDSADLTRLDRAPAVVRPAGTAATLVGEWLPITDVPKALAHYVEHAGVALGVWTEENGARAPGPRHAAWAGLDVAERIRALTRLWLVDDAGPAPLAPSVRRGVRAALLTLEPESWYDLDQVARLVAWLAARPTAFGGPGPEAAATTAGRASFARRDFERAIEVLSWIGVVAVGIDRVGRPVAVRVTSRGTTALG